MHPPPKKKNPFKTSSNTLGGGGGTVGCSTKFLKTENQRSQLTSIQKTVACRHSCSRGGGGGVYCFLFSHRSDVFKVTSFILAAVSAGFAWELVWRRPRNANANKHGVYDQCRVRQFYSLWYCTLFFAACKSIHCHSGTTILRG